MWKRAIKDTLPELGNTWGKRIRNILLLVFALLIVRWLGGWGQMTEEFRWIISSGIALVIVLLGLFLFNLIRAPVYLKFEKEKEPVLKIVAVKSSNYQQSGHTFGLVIENKGTDIADDCRGQIIEIELYERSLTSQSSFGLPVNQCLTWAEQEGVWETNKTFTIPGKSTKILHSIIFRYVSGRPVVEIAYSASQDLRVNNAITNFEYAYMVISVTSQNRSPVYAVCRYRRTAERVLYPELVLLGVTKDKPTISSYPKLDSLGC